MPTVFKFALGAALICASGSVALADVSLQDRQQAACYNDVQKLCGEFLPDSDKTEACMLKMKDKVSARCRKFYTDD